MSCQLTTGIEMSIKYTNMLSSKSKLGKQQGPTVARGPHMISRDQS